MTLIITSLSQNVVTQVSDRKLTYPDGSVASDKTTKAVCVFCADARFSIAYTGLARVGKTQTAPRTDRWLVDYLRESRAADKRFPEIVEGLRSHAANTFSSLRVFGKRRGITFVFAGVGKPGTFAGFLSNQEDTEGRWLTDINDAFDGGWFFRNDRPMRKLDLLIHGAEKTITPEIKAAIAKIRRQYFGRTAEKQVEVFINVLGRASQNRKHGHLIGRDCMSTTITRRGFLANYHPANADSLSYIPHYVGPQFTMTDGWVATDDEGAARGREGWKNEWSI